MDFGVWIDAGNCLEFQWIFGISRDPPKVKVGAKVGADLGVIWALNSRTVDCRPADCRSADRQTLKGAGGFSNPITQFKS